MKITINNKEIELNNDQEKAIKEALGLKKKGLWKPELNQEYYYHDYQGGQWVKMWENDFVDNLRYPIGNCFPSKEVGEKHVEKLKAIQRVKEYIAEHCEEFTPDWEDENQGKYSIYYDHDGKRFGYDVNWLGESYNPLGYLKTEQDAEKVIKNCDKDLKVIFEIE